MSAFDIILDRTVVINQSGVEREHSVDEAMELQTFQAALKGSRMAVRQVLKMIEKREAAIAKLNPAPVSPVRMEHEFDSDNAHKAMQILGIAEIEIDQVDGGYRDKRVKLATWATQAALSRPGRAKLEAKDIEDIKRITVNPGDLKWPRGTIA